MKRRLTAIAALSMALGVVVPAVFASTTGSAVGGRKAISVNGKVVSQPYTRVALDSGNETSYIGVWYLGQAVKAAGGHYTWDSTNKVFDLTIPGVDASKISVLGGVGSGNTTIQVNGTTVKKLNSFAAQDPASGADDITTFVPLYYIGNVFEALGSNSSWDGSTFGFKTFGQNASTSSAKTTSTSLATKGQVTEALLKGLGIQPWTTNQETGENGPGNLSGTVQTFDDVPTSSPEWGFIQADVNWLYTSPFLEEIEPILSPDSTTDFGLTDTVTWSSLDTQYRSHLHIGAIVPNTASQWYSAPSGYAQSADISYIEPGANGQVASSELRWASAVGLMNDIPTLKYVTVADLPQLTKNVQQLTQGYRPLSPGNYQVVYPPKDEYLAYYQNADITDAYRNPNVMGVVNEMNRTQVHVENGVPIVSVDMAYLPTEKDDWVVTATSQTGGPVEVSWDYGKTWHSVAKFVSNNANDAGINPITGSSAWGRRSAYVEIKPAQGSQVNVEMLTGGKVYGQLHLIGESGSGLKVERPRLSVPTYWTFNPAWRPLVTGGATGGAVTPSDFTMQYSQRLYVDGKALSDGSDVIADFTYQGKGTLRSATYHLMAGTPEIEFQVANPADGDEILAKPGTITTEQGISPADPLKYDASVGLWSP